MEASGAGASDDSRQRLTSQLEDLFVSESHRGNGLGKRLFGELGRVAQEKKCGRVEWKVLKVSPHIPVPGQDDILARESDPLCNLPRVGYRVAPNPNGCSV